MAYFLDSTVIVLLLVTIAYAIRLNSKLNLIKNQKQEFASNIKAFHEATENAIIAVEELHVKGEAVCKLIDEKIQKANQVIDDVEFITARARKQLIGLKALDSKTIATSSVAAPVPQKASVIEAQLLQAMRNREFREALNG